MVPVMTRAHPPLHLSVLAAAAAAALAGAACNSDDLEQRPAVTTEGTTEVDPTEVPVFTTAEPEDTTTTGPAPSSPWSCRDAVFCAVQCATNIPNPTPPEHNWQLCFFDDCLEELNHVEWLKLFDLIECTVEKCSATPECMEGTDEECNACYIVTLGNQSPPPGDLCEAQAKACK
jgi:hypothetical protein